MSELRQQVLGLIESCKTVIAAPKGKDLELVDASTVHLAIAMIEQAKVQVPNNKVLEAVKFEGYVKWPTLLAAMQTVYHSLPLPK